MFFSFNFSTFLTLMRFVLTPFIIIFIYRYQWIVAFALFCIAGITDFFDGYFARLYNQETEFGKIIDPLADKFLILSTFFALHGVSGENIIPVWFIAILILKELLLLLGGLILLRRYNFIPSPTLFSKVVTALHLLFIAYFMISSGCCIDYCEIICGLLSICSIGILFDYGYKFYHFFQSR